MKKTVLLKSLAACCLATTFALGTFPALASTIVYESGTKATVIPKDIAPEIPAPVYPQPSIVPVFPPNYVVPTPDVIEPYCDTLSLYVNGKYYSNSLYFQGRTLLLPLRTIAQKGGWSYSYSGGKATLTREDDVVKISLGAKSYKKNGSSHGMKAYSELIDGALYAPWTFFTNALGMRVKIGSTTVKVTTSKATVTSKYSLKVNGKTSDTAPYYSGKTLMLPLRFTVESLGYSYINDASKRQAIFSAKNVDCYIQWDKNSYPVDNQYVELERAPEIKNGVLFVPSSFMSRALKCEVKVSGKKVTVTR